MAEVFRSFDAAVADDLGVFHARVLGRLAADGMWEGWLEFVPNDGTGKVLVGSVESRQPERHDLVYWASGLTPVFLEGALHRARSPLAVRVRTVELPVSDAPAPHATTVAATGRGPEAVLDPFAIAAHSVDVLRHELGALNRPRLVNIIAAFALNPGGEELQWMSDRQLVQFIVTAVDAQRALRAR